MRSDLRLNLRLNRRLWTLCGSLALTIGIASTACSAEPELQIDVEGQPALSLTVAELRTMPLTKLHSAAEKGQFADYTCVAVASILVQAGVPHGVDLRGKNLLNVLEVRARDGYGAMFSLPELDPEFTDKPVWVCFEKEGQPLTEDEGPIRLIIPDEKRHARWVRQVSELRIHKTAQ
jgi:hypothetical protein